MDRRALESELARAASYEQWVGVLTQYFSAHDLEYGHGTDNPADEAFWLVRHLQGWRDEPLTVPPNPNLSRQAAEIAAKRAIERVPLAYLVGETRFAGLKFKVDARVLIPRSPLAESAARRSRSTPSSWCPGRRERRSMASELDGTSRARCVAIPATPVLGGWWR